MAHSINAAEQSQSVLKSLRFRFTALAVLSAAAVLVFTIVSLDSLGAQQAINAQLQKIAQIVQRHMQGDMMHDAINSDLLAARIARNSGDDAALETARREFAEHSASFRANVAANLQEDLAPDLIEKLRAVNTALEAYITAGEAAMTALASGADPKADIAVFDERFSFLEEANEALSNDLLAWADRAQAESKTVADHTKIVIGGVALLAFLFSVLPAFYATRGVFKPLRRMRQTMQGLADGDTGVAVPYIHDGNEMGDVARSVEVFRLNIERIAEIRAEQSTQQNSAEREKREMMEKLARSFDERVQSMIRSVNAAAAELLESAQSIHGVVGTAHKRASNAAAGTQDTSNASQTIAAAVEEMSAAAREIALQISQSSDFVHKTVQQVSDAERASAQLSEANAQIGSIVQLIQDITGQINLLALNATIESARAGEAGRGFAVVASEVKNLASQTSKATEQIAEQIANVQQVAAEVVHAFSSIKNSIEQVDEYSAKIAASAEEQTTTTNEIASNMSSNVNGIARITADINHVMTSSDDANQAASRVVTSAEKLSEQSQTLRAEVRRFIDDIMAA